jgi:hypothetical protein
MESLHFTTFPDYKGDIFVNETWEIEKLHAFPPTAETKGALSLVKQSSFGTLRTDKNSLRHDANVTSVWGCELDYDEGVESFATASARFEAAGWMRSCTPVPAIPRTLPGGGSSCHLARRSKALQTRCVTTAPRQYARRNISWASG